jgi:hypothetical protein
MLPTSSAKSNARACRWPRQPDVLCFTVRADETGQHLDRLIYRPASTERHEDYVLAEFAAQTLLIRAVIGVSRAGLCLVTRQHYSESLR